MRVTTPTDMGFVVKDRRRALGLTQAELASAAAVGRTWIIDLEAGHPRAELGLVLRVMAALGLSLDSFIEEPPVDLDAALSAYRSRVEP